MVTQESTKIFKKLQNINLAVLGDSETDKRTEREFCNHLQSVETYKQKMLLSYCVTT